jgi:hypothetical protein
VVGPQGLEPRTCGLRASTRTPEIPSACNGGLTGDLATSGGSSSSGSVPSVSPKIWRAIGGRPKFPTPQEGHGAPLLVVTSIAMAWHRYSGTQSLAREDKGVTA